VSTADELPQQICEICIEKLISAYEFKKNFLETEQTFQETIKDSSDYVIPQTNTPIEIETENEEYMEEILEVSEPESAEEPMEEIDTEIPDDHKTDPEDLTYIRPKKCYLCDCNFEEKPEKHFEKFHHEIKLRQCTDCQFSTEFPWFLNLHYQVSRINSIYYLNKINYFTTDTC
jgi:hypothetical protein